MGVKTKLSKKDILPFFDVEKLTKTKNGVSDTVYILDEKYVLKLFENAGKNLVKNELELLGLCDGLPIPKIKKKIFYIENKPVIIYKKCNGKSLKKVNKGILKQIGEFLKSFHNRTYKKTNKNKKLFQKSRLKKDILRTNNKAFLEEFYTIDIKLKNDGIIHGDLFLDNASFRNKKLSCVYDFARACEGDFLFDLGVIALTWCNSKKDIKVLLDSYGTDIKVKRFIKYIKYAKLYYSVRRYLDNREYCDLEKRYKRLKKTL